MRKILFSGFSSLARKKYVLSQFPYPSGELHLGHARVYYIGDTLARYYRLQGEEVIYPIGWDSFGLPAENAAILHGKDPLIWTENNIAQMKQQLECLEIRFDWDREISTSRPEYYKWTQQIFTRLFRQGLAYRDRCEVNWDPVDQTVLANEQVDKLGRSWRSGATVEKKMLEQWFFRISKYAPQLQQGLDSLEWIERVKAMQAGWIGFQRGYFINMLIADIQAEFQNAHYGLVGNARVFVADLSLLEEPSSFIRVNLSKQHSESGCWQENSQIGYAVNPLTGAALKIMAGYEQNGVIAELVSDKKGKSAEKSTKTELLSAVGASEAEVMRIRDWSISRQRYWGTPIPIVYCPSCGTVPVPDEQLPVVLPEWTGKGNPLLSEEFRNCRCPKCGEAAQRETDTMDTFVDSSWYFLRFLDPANTKTLCEPTLANRMMPVDIYIGGIEHAIMHLLYARFFMHFLADEGICSFREPFKELVVQGLVKGKTLRHRQTGRYLKPQERVGYPADQIEETYEKMSKSKFNGLNPTQLVRDHGPDELRVALFFAAPPENDVDFSEDMLLAAGRFLRRVEEFMFSFETVEEKVLTVGEKVGTAELNAILKNESELSFRLKAILEKLEASMEKRLMHVYVANAMELFNEIKSHVQASPHQATSRVIAYRVLLPVVEVIAPQTVAKIIAAQPQLKIEWPRASMFEQQVEYLVMQGSKMVRKGRLAHRDGMSRQEICEQAGVPHGDCLIKSTRKNIVIILQ